MPRGGYGRITMPTSDLATEALTPQAHADQPVRAGRRLPVVILGAELAFVTVAAVVGEVLQHRGVAIHAGVPPLSGRWLPHVGIGTPVAVLVAVVVIGRGAAYARTARWGATLLWSYVATVLWTAGLALIDGWHRGIAGRLSTPDEYTPAAAGVTDIGRMLRTFSQHIVSGPPGAWPTHVAGGPPGGFLLFVALDRIGLRGGGWAGVTCILLGALAPIAVAATIRAIGGDAPARAALPFLVLFPGAVWVGTSADGAFAGITAVGVAMLALRRWWQVAVGGVLLGYALYLSYGLILIGVLAMVVLWRKPGRRVRDALIAGAGAAAVVIGFAAAGFWWPTGYHLVKVRYYQGWGAQRPYSYWVWADLAALVLCAGPILVPALRHALVRLPAAIRARPSRPGPAALTWVPLAAVIAILCADLSGLSKAEVERIWLPFAIWLIAAAPLTATGTFPDTDTAAAPSGAKTSRTWLMLQAATALAINSLLLTSW
jgi:hypothetical protein